MRYPWVSRELYDRVAADLERSERERKELIDRVLEQTGRAPAGTEVSPQSEDLVDKTSGALTIAGLRQMAQDAAYKRAGRVV